MLFQNGYQEFDMYSMQQFSLESQTFLHTQWQQTYTRSVSATNEVCHLQQMTRGNRFSHRTHNIELLQIDNIQTQVE